MVKIDGFSNQINAFLKFCRSCQELNRIAASNETDLDNKTQDILHNIELNDNYPDDYVLQGLALREIRKRRREAKDIQRIMTPIVQWTDQNQKTINELERLLGAVRKAEKSTTGRTYMNRTNALEKFWVKNRGRTSIMKQYIIIAACILAGKYVDIPVWFNILFGISAYWAVDQLRRVQEEETCSETK